MGKQLFTNNATSRLASAITDSATTFGITTGDGALFPTLSGGDTCTVTLLSSTAREIVLVTARSSDTFTVTRGYEGTTPVGFAAGDTVSLFLTAKGINDLITSVSAVTAWGALTDGATITWDVANVRESKKSVTLGGSRTLAITNAVNGSSGILRVTQDGTGTRGLTLPSGSKIVGGGGTTAPLSTAAGTVDFLAFEYDGTNYWWTLGKAAA